MRPCGPSWHGAPPSPEWTEPQLILARVLCHRVPSFEQVRFTSSGTEAVMMAVGAARAFTGRPKVAKVEGGYNGSFDGAMVSTAPAMDDAGPASRPGAVPGSAGLPLGTTEATVVLPFNDPAAASDCIDEQAGELAVVVVEPVMGSAGMIPAETEYLEALRIAATRTGALLVFDEVVSFRVAFGAPGALRRDARPHLPRQAGGRRPAPRRGGRSGRRDGPLRPSQGRPAIPHPGSYNANPLSLVAAAATLGELDQAAVDALSRTGAEVRDALTAALAPAGVPVCVTGLGSLFAIHFTEGPVRTYRDSARGDPGLRLRLFLGLFAEGILIDPRGVGCVSLAIGDAEVAVLAEAVEVVAGRFGQDGPPG